jgi:FxsC-like protein
VAKLANDLLRENEYDARVESYEECHDDLSAAEPSAPGLIVIDPWFTLGESARTLLQGLDSLQRPWVRALIPWGNDDAETATSQEKLQESLRLSLPQMMNNSSANLRHALCAIPRTEDDFWDYAILMMQAAGLAYVRHAPTNIAATPDIKPKLQAPGWEESGSAP